MSFGLSVAAQTLFFLKSIALGACLMLLYDVFRILRLAVPTPQPVVLAEDLAFFAVCAVATFVFLVSANYGEVRVFALLGEGFGALLCYLTVSQALMACSKLIIAAVKRLLLLVWIVFLRPIYLLCRLAARGILKITGAADEIFKKNLHRAKYSLKRRRILLYNLIMSGRRNPHGSDKRPAPAPATAPSAHARPSGRRSRKAKGCSKT